jgi:hypothetical protein
MKAMMTFFLVAVAAVGVAADKLLDNKLAASAEVVVRAKRVAADGGHSKYAWFRVQVLQVFKNESGTQITNELSIAAYNGKDGVPKGESTLYLERYHKTNTALWRLVGGGASAGVSHNSN